jgi:hypothetical protein
VVGGACVIVGLDVIHHLVYGGEGQTDIAVGAAIVQSDAAGVGTINGITAGNWLDSAGTTDATVDGQVGLVVSAGKAVGPELFTGTYVTGPATTATYSGRVATVTFGGNMNSNWTNWLSIPKIGPATTGFTVAEFWAKWVSGGNLQAGRGYAATLTVSNGENGGIRKKYAVTAHSSTSVSGYGELSFGALAAGSVWEIEIISVRELPGAHLMQSTAANRPILRLAGGVYAWDFVSSDGFGATLAMTNAGFICSGIKFNVLNASEAIFQNGATAANVRGVWLIKLSSGIRMGISNGTDVATALTPAINVSSPTVIDGFWDASSVSAAVNGATPTTTDRTGNEAPS